MSIVPLLGRSVGIQPATERENEMSDREKLKDAEERLKQEILDDDLMGFADTELWLRQIEDELELLDDDIEQYEREVEEFGYEGPCMVRLRERDYEAVDAYELRAEIRATVTHLRQFLDALDCIDDCRPLASPPSRRQADPTVTPDRLSESQTGDPVEAKA